MNRIIKYVPNEINLNSICIKSDVDSILVDDNTLGLIKKEADVLFKKGWLVVVKAKEDTVKTK